MGLRDSMSWPVLQYALHEKKVNAQRLEWSAAAGFLTGHQAWTSAYLQPAAISLPA